MLHGLNGFFKTASLNFKDEPLLRSGEKEINFIRIKPSGERKHKLRSCLKLFARIENVASSETDIILLFWSNLT